MPPLASRRIRAACGAVRGRRRSASRPARSARSSTRAASAVAAAKPVPTAPSLPSSAVSGARASSADGPELRRARARRSSDRRSSGRCPRSCRRRAGSSRARRRAAAPRSSPGRRDGRAARRRAAAPAAGPRSSGRRGRCADRATIRAGRSRPLVVAVARPLRLVAGASLAKAERSSASVDACSSPSGQAANGRTTAFASSDCAACGRRAAATRARRRDRERGERAAGARARLPRRRGCRPRRRRPWRRSRTADRRRSSPRPTRWRARGCACSAAKRCSAPPSAPRWTRAAQRAQGEGVVAGADAQLVDARLRGSRSRPAGAASPAASPAPALVGAASPGSRVTRSACRLAIVRRSHRPALPRLASSACQRGASRRSTPLLPGRVMSIRSAEKSPSSEPRGATTFSCGARVTTQALPAAVRSAQTSTPTATAASTTSSAAPPPSHQA